MGTKRMFKVGDDVGYRWTTADGRSGIMLGMISHINTQAQTVNVRQYLAESGGRQIMNLVPFRKLRTPERRPSSVASEILHLLVPFRKLRTPERATLSGLTVEQMNARRAAVRQLNERYKTAEGWFRAVVDFYKPIFAALGYAVPKFHISSGFTTAGARMTRVAGQCFTNDASADKANHIFLNPRLVEPISLVNTVVHEVIHAIVGNEEGHKGKFKSVALAIGMDNPMKSTPWTEVGELRAIACLHQVGAFPRAAFVGKMKKQGTRLIKAVCPDCGYNVRVTAKWVKVAAPICPDEDCSNFQGEMLAEMKEAV